MTNEPDPELEALIPRTIAGATVVKPPDGDFGITPGNFAEPFGDLGLRFQSLVIAYVTRPRLSLYAARVDPPAVATASLRPYLAAAGEYVGIAGLHPEAWKSVVVGGHQVWTRGDDEATLPGTTLYCWSSGPYVFLLIGSSDAANRQMVAALPGEPAPTPTPRPSVSPTGTGGATPSAAASGASAAASASASTPSG